MHHPGVTTLVCGLRVHPAQPSPTPLQGVDRRSVAQSDGSGERCPASDVLLGGEVTLMSDYYHIWTYVL